MVVSTVSVGKFMVQTTDNRGWSVDEIADRAVDRIVYVGGKSHPVIREQAEAFKKELRNVLVGYLNEAVKCDRATLAVKFKDAGFPELTKLLD